MYIYTHIILKCRFPACHVLVSANDLADAVLLDVDSEKLFEIYKGAEHNRYIHTVDIQTGDGLKGALAISLYCILCTYRNMYSL